MDISITLGWWLVPAVFTVAILLAWRIWGVRMQPNNGSMFPDAAGALFELLGYVVALLLAAVAWLVWALL
jgi:hypothetical protein